MEISLKEKNRVYFMGAVTQGLTQGKTLKLNIGCGKKTYPAFVNIDKVSLPNIDKKWDLEKTPQKRIIFPCQERFSSSYDLLDDSISIIFSPGPLR